MRRATDLPDTCRGISYFLYPSCGKTLWWHGSKVWSGLAVLAVLCLAAMPLRAQTVTPIGEALADLDADGAPDRLGEKFVVRGVVLTEEGANDYIYVQDGSGTGRLVEGADPDDDRAGDDEADDVFDTLGPGDLFEAEGVVTAVYDRPVIVVSRIIEMGEAPLPEPLPLSAAAANAGEGLNRRVRMQGRLVRLGRDAFANDFAVSDRSGIVGLKLSHGVEESPEVVKGLIEADHVELIGILEAEIDPGINDLPYEIRITSPRDIRFLSGPPYGVVVLALVVVAMGLLVLHLITRRRIAERRAAELADFTRELRRRDIVLEAVGFAAHHLVSGGEWSTNLRQALAQLGKGTEAERVYLFECTQESQRSVSCLQAEWVGEGTNTRLADPHLQHLVLDAVGLKRWESAFVSNESIYGLSFDFPPEERAFLEGQGIRSILAIPIWVGDAWWGFLGFDECTVDRVWTAAEREVLSVAGGIISSAIQRQRDEDALRDSEEQFRQMALNIREVYWMTNLDATKLLYVTPAYEETYGRSRSELARDPSLLVEAILPEDRHLLLEQMERVREGKGGGASTVEFRIRRPDDTQRWIRNRTFDIRDEHGWAYRIGGVATDITDQKKMEEELRRTNRLEAIGHLAAGIAHEINTPIQYVGDNLRFLDQSYAEVSEAVALYEQMAVGIASGTPPNPDQIRELRAHLDRLDLGYILKEAPRACAQALEGVERVAEIVRAMKEFSHPGVAEKIPTDINKAILSTTTVARNEWKYVAELVTNFDPELPLIPVLPGDFNQAILNLVVNAAHAIADASGGDETKRGVITVSTGMLGDSLEVRVKDTGTGIPERVRERIFDPFFTTKEVGRGTGQGLTFVHSIVVEKHGGTLTFETEAGAGTTFILRFPVMPPNSDLSEAA